MALWVVEFQRKLFYFFNLGGEQSKIGDHFKINSVKIKKCAPEFILLNEKRNERVG